MSKNYNNISKIIHLSISLHCQIHKIIMFYINLPFKDIINLLRFMLGKYNLKLKGKVKIYLLRIIKKNLRIGLIKEIIKVILLYFMLHLMGIYKLSPILLIKELILKLKLKLISMHYILLLRKILSSLFFTLEIPSISMISMMTEVLPFIGHHILIVNR